MAAMIRVLDQAVRLLLTVLAFAGFGAGGVLLSLVVLPLAALAGGGPGERVARSQRLVRHGYLIFHDYMRIFRLLRVNPRDLQLQLPGGPYVLIANHPTLVDVTVLLGAANRLTCVVKPAHFGGPLRYLLKSCGHINGGGGDPVSGAAVMLQAVQRLQAGLGVLVFPEGTRSPEGSLRRFHRGAFEIAARAGVPVVPVLLSCEPPVLAKEAPWYRVPAEVPRLTVHRLATLDPAQWAGNSKAMAADVEAMYRQAVDAGAGAKNSPPPLAPKPHLA